MTSLSIVDPLTRSLPEGEAAADLWVSPEDRSFVSGVRHRVQLKELLASLTSFILHRSRQRSLRHKQSMSRSSPQHRGQHPAQPTPRALQPAQE
ncbi:unnamed protein product [Arctogadus glacialis]